MDFIEHLSPEFIARLISGLMFIYFPVFLKSNLIFLFPLPCLRQCLERALSSVDQTLYKAACRVDKYIRRALTN